MAFHTDVILMAGGRISGDYAAAAGATVKALVSVGGEPIVRRVARVLRETRGIGRVCVVGPDEVRDAVAGLCAWSPETGSALGNFKAGLEHLQPAGDSRLLLCGTDVAALKAAALEDFIQRAPEAGDIWMPVVHRDPFEARFPDGRWVYVPLADGHFTAGSQFLVRPRAVLENLPLIESLFERRKSQVAMAGKLGLPFLFKLLTRRLRVHELEARASTLTGCRCRAVLDCHPELAFDIDNLAEWRYAESLFGKAE
ncbi:MAG: NTP transferase domain-containing protein [Actinomycetota bacterium]